jgi:hypothetical protein
MILVIKKLLIELKNPLASIVNVLSFFTWKVKHIFKSKIYNIKPINV